MKNALILLAGGNGKRFRLHNEKKPKQFVKIGNSNFIEYFLTHLDNKIFDTIQIVIKKTDQHKYLYSLKKDFPKHKIRFVNSGSKRQISSKNGVYSLKKYKPKNPIIIKTNKNFDKILPIFLYN